MRSLFKGLCLWYVLFGQVSVRAEGLYFSPKHCWGHAGSAACQFANNNPQPKMADAAIELVAGKNGKGELEGETLFLLPGRYWVSSEKSLTIQTRHGNINGEKFSILVEIEKEGVRCHVVSGSIKAKGDAEIKLGQSVRYDRESHDVFTVSRDDLLENWKEILALSKKFAAQKKDYVFEWSRQTKILAQAQEAEVQRSIASAQEREYQRQLAVKKEQEAMKERRRLFREKNYLD